MHRQAAIVAFLQTEELDLNKSNQQLHGASSVSDEQGLPSELRPGVETVRVVEPLFALVDPRLQPHTPLIREESLIGVIPRWATCLACLFRSKLRSPLQDASRGPRQASGKTCP